MRQAIGINSSLMTLGKVIQHLVEGEAHVPYLESRLTTMLRSCFGGDCMTRVLVSCRSDQSHAEESVNSLRFGERCSRITNQLSVATSSVAGALAAIDASLRQCEEGLRSLQARGVGGAVAAKLQERRDRMRLKRKDLARLQDHPVPGATVASA